MIEIMQLVPAPKGIGAYMLVKGPDGQKVEDKIKILYFAITKETKWPNDPEYHIDGVDISCLASGGCDFINRRDGFVCYLAPQDEDSEQAVHKTTFYPRSQY